MKNYRTVIALGLMSGVSLAGSCVYESADDTAPIDLPEITESGDLDTHDANEETPLLADVEEVEAFEVYGAADNAHEVRIRAAGQNIRFTVEPNTDLLAPDFRVIRDDKTLTLKEAGLNLPLRGRVQGDSDSWIRFSVVDGGYEGIFLRDGELWELRGPQEARRSGHKGWVLGRADFDDYLPSAHGGAYTCGTTSSYQLAAPTGTREVQAAGCKTIDIALVGDYTHVAKLGSAAASESERLARLNETDGLYRADLNRGFQLKEMLTFPTQGVGPAFNVSAAPTTPLDQFSAWKKVTLPQRGLAHLFVGRTTSGTVGLAWVGATCHANYGAGVSNYLGRSRASTIVFAHEVGHNFGASHDANGAAFLMAPMVNTSATAFSPASKTAIASHLARVSCFVDCDDDSTTTDTTSTDTTSTDTTSTGTTSSTTTTTETTSTPAGDIPVVGVKIYSRSSEETAKENGFARNAVDNNNATIWHSRWSSSAARPPHNLVFDLGGNVNISGLQYLPRQDASTSGHVASYRIYLWIGGQWVSKAQGTFSAGKERKTVNFGPTVARYIAFIADTSSGGDTTASAAEIAILERK
jgi:hypothetical protein